MTSPDNVTRDVLKVVIAFFMIDCAKGMASNNAGVTQ